MGTLVKKNLKMNNFFKSRRNSIASEPENQFLPSAPENPYNQEDLLHTENAPDPNLKISPEPEKPTAGSPIWDDGLEFDEYYDEPNLLQKGIDKITNKTDINDLTRAAKEMSENITKNRTKIDQQMNDTKNLFDRQNKETNENLIDLRDQQQINEEKIKRLSNQLENSKDLMQQVLQLAKEKPIKENTSDIHELLKKGVEKEKFTKQQILAYPKYVKSHLKKRTKSKKKKYDTSDTSDSDSEFSDSIDMNLIDSKNSHTSNASENTDKIIEIADMMNNINKNKYIGSNIAETSDLPLGTQLRLSLIKRKISDYEACLAGNVQQLGITNFVKQFPSSQFRNFSQQEYNVVLHKFVGKDLIKKCAEQKLLPSLIDTQTYLTELQRIQNAEMLDESMVEQKLANYVSFGTDILKTYNDISSIIDQISNSVWTDTEKEKKLYFAMKRALPPTMAMSFTQLESQNYRTGKIVYPDKQTQKAFFCKYSTIIDEEMGKKRYFKARINEIHEGNPSTDDSDSIQQKSKQSNILHKETSDLNKKIDQLSENIKQLSAPKQKTELEQKFENLSAKILQINHQPKQKGELEQKIDDLSSKIMQITNQTKQNGDLGPLCTTCNRPYHTAQFCFHHPDPETAYQNQIKKGARCLLCADENHNARYCKIYPNMKPCFTTCYPCYKERDIICNHKKEACIYKKN